MINFQWFKFSELTVELLYSILALRADVFIIEQNRVCLDPDGKDIYALHLLGIDNGVLVAYIRLFPPTDIEKYISFGRVLTAKTVRTKGYGKLLTAELLNFCQRHFPKNGIECCAQQYLQKFYENFGFKTYGDIFEVDKIPHILMRKESPNQNNRI